MGEQQQWHFVFAKRLVLAAVGVESAIPVSYDPARGLIELLDNGAESNQWVVPLLGNIDTWTKPLATRFGILPIHMEGRILKDFSSAYVQIDTESQRQLFTEEMEQAYIGLMNAVM